MRTSLYLSFLKCLQNKQCRNVFFSSSHKVHAIHTNSFHYTLILDSVVIKILNNKRLVELANEFLQWDFLEIDNYHNQKNKFKIATGFNAHVYKKNMLVMKKIDAVPLSSFIEEKSTFIKLMEKSIDKLLYLHINHNGFYHSDFHIENILIKDNEIYFVDFDFKYKEKYLQDAFYIDLVNLVYHLKKNYYDFFKKYKNDFTKSLFMYKISDAVKNLYPYINHKEIFDVFEKSNLNT